MRQEKLVGRSNQGKHQQQRLKLWLGAVAVVLFLIVYHQITGTTTLDVQIDATIFPETARGVVPSGQQQEEQLYKSSSDLWTSLKRRFEALPINNEKRVRPLILQNIIPRRRGRLDKETIVMATHLSTKKFQNMLLQLKYWNGPASVALYIKSLQDIDRLQNFTETYISQQILQETSFHLVMEKTTELPYPYNILRKVAMESIESDYFVAMDVDLIPLPGDCYSKLMAAYSRIDIPNKQKTLFVLPAFSLYASARSKTANAEWLPLTKAGVIQKVKKKRMGQFWGKDFAAGHFPTQYDVWLNNTSSSESGDAYLLPRLSIGQALNYEPYVMGYKPGIPKYWEDFRGHGWDKISFFRECHALGYNYAVLNNFYCVHLDHPSGNSKEQYKENRQNRGQWYRFRRDYILDSVG
eukprot:scaffold3410_cov141-Cylindrotheca_fusiformis.AAC.29